LCNTDNPLDFPRLFARWYVFRISSEFLKFVAVDGGSKTRRAERKLLCPMEWCKCITV
jgi:hypothetical protein